MRGSSGNNETIIKEIKHRAQAFSSCSFDHEGRLSNVEAHSLRKHTLSLSQGRHVWFLNPHDPVVISTELVFDQ